MCENYREIGIENIKFTDMGTAAWNFLSVALGGTIIGMYE